MTLLGRILCLSTAVVVALVGTFLLKSAFVTGSPKCSTFDFPCENGECIDAGLWCDTTVDCADGSDEKYCKMASFKNKDPNKCPSTYFKCKDGPCIPLAGKCDDYANCEDSSDEEKCMEGASSEIDETPSFKPDTSRLDTWTTPATTPSTTSGTPTNQTSVKSDSHATHSSNSTDAEQHSVEIVFSDLQPSDYSRQREMARNWLLSQRKNDFGWGDETPRALTALYLSDLERPIRRNESDMLMVKQLEVQLSLDMARNGTKAMKLVDLALYINALLASCKDPKNFYGENLVRTLRNGVDAAHKGNIFVNPSIYLTLCINNATTYDDTRKLHDVFTSRNAAIGRIDIQSLALLSTMCIFRNTDYLNASTYDDLRRQFVLRADLPGNVYEASLLAQALHELRVARPGLIEFILKQQQEDGSFGGILATYLVLPALSGRSFLQMDTHCGQPYTADPAPIEVLKNKKGRKIYVTYSLKYGNPPEITQTIQMQVAEGMNFLDVMRLAQEVNPKFRFMLDGNRDVPVVYSVGGIPNDAEKGAFWSLYLTSNRKGNDGRLAPYSGNFKELISHAGDEFVFWMKSI